MIKKVFPRLFPIIISVCALGTMGLLLSRLITCLYTYANRDMPMIYSLENVPRRPVAIVFGAGLRRDGSPTTVLRERVTVAADLYKAGKVAKLLMSGDNRTIYHNEPESMRRYAVSLGVPEEDIILDFAGLRTYDTCYRAREIFHVRDAILVTQDFHMPRSLYTCNMLGVSAIGVSFERYYYTRSLRAYWNLRESIASLVALWDVHVARPIPILGKPEPIFTHFTERS